MINPSKILSQNILQKDAMYLVDNRKGEHYAYILLLVTGYQSKANTTSNIGIKLFGTQAESKVSKIYIYTGTETMKNLN